MVSQCSNFSFATWINLLPSKFCNDDQNSSLAAKDIAAYPFDGQEPYARRNVQPLEWQLLHFHSIAVLLVNLTCVHKQTRFHKQCLELAGETATATRVQCSRKLTL